MLATLPVVAIPDLFKRRVPPQVVNVPVRAVGRLQVVREPGADASATECAANVHVETGLEPQRAQSSDMDKAFRSRGKYQGIRSRLAFYLCQQEPHPILSLDGTHRSRVHNCSQPRRRAEALVW